MCNEFTSCGILPLQQWDETLAAVAQDWADRCFFSPNRQTTVNHPALGPAVRKGENLYAAGLTEGIEAAIRSWFSDDESSEYTQVCETLYTEVSLYTNTLQMPLEGVFPSFVST